MASYAHVIANSQTFYDEQDQYDMKLNKVNDPNSTHRLVGVGTYGIPFGKGRRFGASLPKIGELALGGWRLSGVYTYRIGQLMQFDGMVAPQSAFWFDNTGFGCLPAFTRRANPLYHANLEGPSLSKLDAVLSKRFAVRDRFRPEFRLEADFGRTNALVGGNAGRQLRCALRVEF
jgi:hypothetical protein